MSKKTIRTGQERVEIVAPPGWTASVDEMASVLGINRSCYIRLAVAERLIQDRQRYLVNTRERK